MILICGLGFTGRRLARKLLQRGVPVGAIVRGVARFDDLRAAGLILFEGSPNFPAVSALPPAPVLAHFIPPLPEPENTKLRVFIQELKPTRIVYISSTGVYGNQTNVSENTAPAPVDERGIRRMAEEEWIRSGRWKSLILRAAAIYGPFRGVHTSVREGRLPRGSGSGVVSRIHVDDLAALAEAGLFSSVEGAWPVGDDEPCSSEDIARWLSEKWKVERLPESGANVRGRRVDGTKIRELLDVKLAHPSWKGGIDASLQEEELENSKANRF